MGQIAHNRERARSGQNYDPSTIHTPTSLRLVERLKEQDAYRLLSEQLTDLGALTGAGPAVVGILVSCREQYATIQDLPIDEQSAEAMVFRAPRCSNHPTDLAIDIDTVRLVVSKGRSSSRVPSKR